ncbi:MAG: hypothetical protein MUC92_11030 [Fimbriimonadaceae bacterium]|nr:hypothetical protein [Fimbriimonadaceae bacterium]
MKAGRSGFVAVLALTTLVGVSLNSLGSLDPARRIEPLDEVSQVYGKHTKDYWFCHELSQSRGSTKLSLTKEEEERLFALLVTENRVSKVAAVALYSYSRGDKVLASRLVEAAPKLIDSDNSAVRESGVSLIKFLDLRGHDAKLGQIRSELREKSHFTLEDVGLVLALDSYFDLAR